MLKLLLIVIFQSYFFPVMNYNPIENDLHYNTDDAIVIKADKLTTVSDEQDDTKENQIVKRDSRKRKQFYQAVGGDTSSDGCVTNRGALGRCVTMRQCYPYFKIPDLVSYDSWVLGMENMCTFNSESGAQVYGVCCDNFDDYQYPPPVMPFFPYFPNVDPFNEYGPNSVHAFPPPNWPPPLPTHPPDHTIPPLPTHPPNHGYPDYPASTTTTRKPASSPPSKPPVPSSPTKPASKPTAKPTNNPTYWPPTYPTYPSQPSYPWPPSTPPTTVYPDTEYIPSNDTDCGIKNGYQDQERIVGGQNAEPGEWPWMAAILNSGRLFCGGSLIDDIHILTAAHCIAHMGPWDVARLKVYLGDHNIKSKGDVPHVERRVKKVVRHRGFDPHTLYNDIAILTLDAPVQFTRTIRPLCLPYTKASYTGRTATVIGWGSLREMGPLPAILQEVNIPIWTNTECHRKYGYAAPGGIVDHFLCAGKSSKDSCSGDSGGPLMINDGRWTQIGIVSWGIGCGKGQYPGVYTRITSFMTWITKNMKT